MDEGLDEDGSAEEKESAPAPKASKKKKKNKKKGKQKAKEQEEKKSTKAGEDDIDAIVNSLNKYALSSIFYPPSPFFLLYLLPSHSLRINKKNRRKTRRKESRRITRRETLKEMIL